MKTLLLLVGLLLTWENGRVLGDQMVSDAELQGKWSRGPSPKDTSSLPGPEALLRLPFSEPPPLSNLL